MVSVKRIRIRSRRLIMNAKLLNLRRIILLTLRSSLRLALLSVTTLSLMQPTPAYAAGLTVTTLDDELNSDGDCSLREAITAANSNTAVDACPAGNGKDTITFNVIGTITLGSSLPTITEGLKIVGPGPSSLVIGSLSGGPGYAIQVAAGVALALQALTVSDNCCGAILNHGTLTLEATIVSGNSGGGIANEGGAAMILKSTISSNQGGSGGGIKNQGGSITIINSTISGNEGGLGGGIFSAQSNPKRVGIKLINSTVAFNQAGFGGGIYNFVGTVEVLNTIIANNSVEFLGGDCSGNATTSKGHNLDSDGSCNLTAAGDLSNTSPLLGPLADNGGPTQTHALLPGSPAIDSALNESCPNVDQRGFPRPVDGNGDSVAICDMGSLEAEPE
jgi:CSLREA domain-containing protein